MKWLATVVLAPAVLGAVACAVPRQMLASPDDLRDYRAFRLAAREGPRLASAQRYLRRHPRGAWAGEVRSAFEAEEPSWFEEAQASREKARQYLVDLPEGPHAEAARALLVAFDTQRDDIDTLILLAGARRTAALLDHETERRRRMTERILDEVAALLDPATWRAVPLEREALGEPPPRLLEAVLEAPPRRTWGSLTVKGGGSAANTGRLDQVFFVVPTPDGAEARAVDVAFELVLERGRVAEGRVKGQDLFVRWAEALLVRVLDPTDPGQRRAAATAVAEVLGGALEASLPAARCARGSAAPAPADGARGQAEGQEILVARACDGWIAEVTMGAGAGGEDVIDVRGPT